MNTTNHFSKSSQHALRLLTIAILCLCTSQAFADGKVFPKVAYPSDVKIPDQSALLIWSDSGVERLVIETRFVGAGTDFAWVVPLPSVPEIEPATAGMFPTLRYCLRPELRDDVYSWWGVVLMASGIAWLLLTVRPNKAMRRTTLDIWVCVLTTIGYMFSIPSGAIAAGTFLLFYTLLRVAVDRVRGEKTRFLTFLLVIFLEIFLGAGIALPTLGGPHSGRLSAAVEVLDRRLVGIFDTATIAGKDANALLGWLTENKFAISPDARPVIESHVRDGWVFVATKVHRPSSGDAPTTPHPLSFTFKTPRPVYPLRLTGVGNSELSVELFVAGAERAHIEGFKATECHKIERSDGNWRDASWGMIGHPQLLAWLGNTPVITRLEARLQASDMQKDAEITWQNYHGLRRSLYSTTGAAIMAANWAIPLACLVALVLGMKAYKSKMPPRRATLLGMEMLAWTIIGVIAIYSIIPTVPVKMQRDYLRFRNYFQELARDCERSHSADQSVDLNSVRAEIARHLGTFSRYRENNALQGGPIHEEDSPGNYTLRETPEGIEIIFYDATGAAKVLGLIPKNKTE